MEWLQEFSLQKKKISFLSHAATNDAFDCAQQLPGHIYSQRI